MALTQSHKYGRIKSEVTNQNYAISDELLQRGITIRFDAYFDVYQVHYIIQHVVKTRIDRFYSDPYCDKVYNDYVTSGNELADFVADTNYILDKIDAMGPIVIKRGSGRTYCSNKEMRRIMLLCEYMELCKDYVSLAYSCDVNMPKVEYCLHCGKSFKEAVAKNENYWKCRCGYISYYHRSNSSEVEIGSEYDPRVTFVKECTYFQGKEDEPLPPKLFERLDEFFWENNRMRRADVLKRPKDKYGKTKGTSLELLICGLKGCGYSSLYKRANGIGKLYWGWILPDLQPHMGAIMNYYELYLVGYSKISDRVRKSNISLQSTLLRILDLVGIPVRNEDFKLCTTTQSIEMCEDLWYKVCIITDMPYKRRF